MMDFDQWQEIYFSLKQHKLRTGLTAFGVIWGIFMLVILMGVGNGVRYDNLANFRGSANAVYFWTASKTQLAYQGFEKGRSINFNMEDKIALKNEILEAEKILEVNVLGGWIGAQYVTHGQKSGAFATSGAHTETASLGLLKPIYGRFINQLDYDERRKVAVIGDRVYKALFEPDENPVGQSIIISNIYFKVVGVFVSEAIGDDAKNDSEHIFIPNSTLQHTFNQMNNVSFFQIMPKAGISAKLVEQKGRAVLNDRHHIHPNDKGVLGSYNTEETFLKFSGVFTGIKIFSWVVAIGTIFAGVIGVGNIMLIIVKERTREIGLRKALGATSKSIVAMIVQEAIVITSVAGYCGLVFGVLALEILKKTAQGTESLRFLTMAAIDFKTALLAIFILVSAGCLAALLPARRAAQVNPITALQDE